MSLPIENKDLGSRIIVNIISILKNLIWVILRISDSGVVSNGMSWISENRSLVEISSRSSKFTVMISDSIFSYPSIPYKKERKYGYHRKIIDDTFHAFNLDNNDVLAFLRNNNAHNKYHLSNLHSSKSPHICRSL